MLTLTDIRRVCSTGSVKTEGKSHMDFGEVVKIVVDEISEKRKDISLDQRDYDRIVRDVISNFIIDKLPVVTGYVDANDNVMVQKLTHDLENEILGWGQLTKCRDDEEIREIQVNGSAIFVDGKGGFRLLREPSKDGKLGKPITWATPEDSMNFLLNRLAFSGERLRKDRTQVNARTKEGFRLSATHPDINPPTPDRPTVQWPTYTIRKIGDSFNESDFITYKSAVQEMLDAQKAFAKAKLGIVYVGQTSSGKSTSLKFYFVNLEDQARPIMISNPTEFVHYVVEDGDIINNAVYWEASDNANKEDPNSNTVNNLINHSLRNNADILAVQEIRSSEDFGGVARASNTGTAWMTTFHSHSVRAALDRMALEFKIIYGIDMDTARELAAEYACIMVYQDRIGDYSRKQMEIAEVRGYNRETKDYEINYLYAFQPTSVKYTEDNLPKIEGHFLKVGNISEELQEKIMLKGVGERYTKSFLYNFDKDYKGKRFEGKILGSVMFPDLK